MSLTKERAEGIVKRGVIPGIADSRDVAEAQRFLEGFKEGSLTHEQRWGRLLLNDEELSLMEECEARDKRNEKIVITGALITVALFVISILLLAAIGCGAVKGTKIVWEHVKHWPFSHHQVHEKG